MQCGQVEGVLQSPAARVDFAAKKKLRKGQFEKGHS